MRERTKERKMQLTSDIFYRSNRSKFISQTTTKTINQSINQSYQSSRSFASAASFSRPSSANSSTCHRASSRRGIRWEPWRRRSTRGRTALETATIGPLSKEKKRRERCLADPPLSIIYIPYGPSPYIPHFVSRIRCGMRSALLASRKTPCSFGSVEGDRAVCEFRHSPPTLSALIGVRPHTRALAR